MGQNLLGSESSPYLLQHKDNPVWWRAWNSESFEAAKQENKPIFLSIGYSTCYWCHVMEHDSFERQDVADMLNQHFVCIKVDREERPDVDAIYMDAVVAISGHGGWPMSVFLTPDLKPFFGGTFYYHKDFLKILEALNGVWHNERSKVESSAQELYSHIQRAIPDSDNKKISDELLSKAFEVYEQSFDETDGGFGGAPKFPPSQQVSFLLRVNRRNADGYKTKKSLEMSLVTLEAMARGGIYDQLGGGFHRYSTDDKWIVPHFEKMLYDNALLCFTYLEAYQVTKSALFKEVARETIEYCLRELKSPQGGFFAAQDAGEVEKEGEYYVWETTALQKILTDSEYQLLSSLYPISSGSNFESKYHILTFPQPRQWEQKLETSAKALQKKLLDIRMTRQMPHRDEKILTAWNGLMISALSKAYQVMSERKYLDAARETAGFIKTNLFKNGELFRSFAGGRASHAGCLEDYAFLIEGLLHLYESSGEEHWFNFAMQLQKIQDELLSDAQGGYFSSKAPELIVKKRDFIDGATPSGNSVSALNLLRIFALTSTKVYEEKAQRLITQALPYVERYPGAFPKLLQALDFVFDRSREIVIFEGNALDLGTYTGHLFPKFLPNKVLVQVEKGGKSLIPISQSRTALDGQTTVYVCEHGTCSLPVHSIEDFLKSLV